MKNAFKPRPRKRRPGSKPDQMVIQALKAMIYSKQNLN